MHHQSPAARPVPSSDAPSCLPWCPSLLVSSELCRMHRGIKSSLSQSLKKGEKRRRSAPGAPCVCCSCVAPWRPGGGSCPRSVDRLCGPFVRVVFGALRFRRGGPHQRWPPKNGPGRLAALCQNLSRWQAPSCSCSAVSARAGWQGRLHVGSGRAAQRRSQPAARRRSCKRGARRLLK